MKRKERIDSEYRRRKVKRGGGIRLRMRKTHTPSRLQMGQATLDCLGWQSHIVRPWFPQRRSRDLHRKRNSMLNPVSIQPVEWSDALTLPVLP